MTEWACQTSTGSAAAFHQRPPDLDPATGLLKPSVWIHQVRQPALVLGSTQTEEILLTAKALAAGYEVVHRHSGGGLVLVSPSSSIWIDVLLPSKHSLWEEDISRAFHWIGRLWQETLIDLGVAGTEVHRGPLLNQEHGRVLCFAGLGSGEISIEGSKVVGLSQRRTRAGARFQGLLIAEWDGAPFRSLVRPQVWPTDLDLESIRVGHPSLSPAVLRAVPETFVSNLRRLG